MIKDKYKKNVLITYSVLFTISLLSFIICSFINWSLLTGFILGSIFSIINYFISEIYSFNLLSKKRKFKWVFFISFLKHFIWIIIFISVIIGIIFSNHLLNNDWINGIFNLFTFIYGASLILISLFFYNFIEIYSDKINKKKGQ